MEEPKLTYEVETTEDGQSRISLTCDGTHIGSLWGTLHINEKDSFERENNIIHIYLDDERIATLWNAHPKTVVTKKEGK